MTDVVCLPDEQFKDEVQQAVPQASVVVWDGHGAAPAEAAEVGFIVPPYPKADWDEDQFAAVPNARVLQLMSAGFELWTPIAPAAMTICNGRGIHGASTAELALLGLLAQWRRLPEFFAAQQRSTWQPETGETADGKKVLVLGAGDIGGHLQRSLAALGAETTLVGRHARDGVAGMDELPELCATHDALVVAVPLTDQTRHLVDATLLARMPDGAVLVNVARGPVVNTDALLAEAGRLRAVLDVTDPEPLPADHPLWTAPGVIVTPHVGGGATGWRRRAAALLAAQVGRFVRGEELDNVVRPGTS